MNVKITIELPEQQVAFIERRMEEGGYASVSEVIAESLRDAMLAENDEKRAQDTVTAMAGELRRRLELPDDQWIPMDENDNMFERLEERLKQKHRTAAE